MKKPNYSEVLKKASTKKKKTDKKLSQYSRKSRERQKQIRKNIKSINEQRGHGRYNGHNPDWS